MNIFSHFSIGLHFSRYLKKEIGIPIGRYRFIFGNLKPDISGELLYKPHTSSAMFAEKIAEMEEYANKISAQSQRKIDNVLLGEFCHYISDFFCLAHNDAFDKKRHHLRYEWRLNAKLRKTALPASSLQRASSVDELIAQIRKKHLQYLNSNHSESNDIYYIVNMCHYLLNSIIYLLKREKHLLAA